MSETLDKTKACEIGCMSLFYADGHWQVYFDREYVTRVEISESDAKKIFDLTEAKK